MTIPPNAHAIVIGAGLSGMAAATELLKRGVPVTILEASDRVADPWRARHPRLRLNIHRHFTRLPGHHEPRAIDRFLPRDAVVDYLGDYADGLKEHIVFNTSVLSLRRDGDHWQVNTNNDSYTCTDVVVATGREKVPEIPVWPGLEDFGGKVIHAAEFGDPSDYDGRNIVVVGAGNSGSDVLNHLSRSNPGRVWVAVRHGPSILPSKILGFSLQRMANLFARFPKWSLDPVFGFMQWTFFGNLRRHGLPRHKLGGGSRMLKDGVTFALDDGFVAALKAGRFEAVPQVVGFGDYTVKLANGRKLRPDVVICATGYRPDLEGLFGELGALDAKGYPRQPMGQEDVSNPGLWFTGYTPVFQGFFHAAGVSAVRIAAQVAARTERAPNAPHQRQVAHRPQMQPRFAKGAE